LSSPKVKKAKKVTMVVAGKTFKFIEGDESELEAYSNARRHLRELHDKAVARRVNTVIAPTPATLTRRDN